MQAPYTYYAWTGILDKWGAPANPYADVRGIMATLVDHGIPIAIATRNPDVASVSNLLRTIKFACKKGSISIYDAVGNPAYIQAYGSGGCGGKTKHFTALRQVTGVDFSQMIFFDDLEENIHFAERLGITSVLLRHWIGLTWESLIAGLVMWRSKHAISEAKAEAGAEAKAENKV
jgi:magnesium-dependent phosphatase 1